METMWFSLVPRDDVARTVQTLEESEKGFVCPDTQNIPLGAVFKKRQMRFQLRTNTAWISEQLPYCRLLSLLQWPVSLRSVCCHVLSISKRLQRQHRWEEWCVSWVQKACFSKIESLDRPAGWFHRGDYSVNSKWPQTPISASIFCRGAGQLGCVWASMR